ncbi:asparaginase [Paenibacillus marchantiophytorum]|uniref:Asparaginase n=1 Tax=Paenibacillus marchantiophytorum TaxID=1619310 RepID=A0ABQ1F5R8_9BACL|nr:asparaginase [Paenibacillus marchantiophytorum]GGA00475.1 asparaginase [Paenibacillus marchantiophytorum]
MTHAALLVEERRGHMVECEYWGHVVGIDVLGGIRYQVGDPYHVTYLRSAAKPFQAIPFFRRQLHKKFGLTVEEQAVLTASHRGQSFHVNALESVLDKFGLAEGHLVCGASYPLHAPSHYRLLHEGQLERKLYHNCSGKHLGHLAVCLAEGYALQGYEKHDHPLQQEVRAVIGQMAGLSEERLQHGVDGCGLPVYALPLYHAALAFLKLARPELIEDAATSAAVRELTSAMNSCPEWVSGTELICPALLKDANIVAKGGAKGIYCFALKREGLSFALKVADGSEDKWAYVVAAILSQIGYQDEATIARLLALCPHEIRNSLGDIVGRHRVGFQLA